MSGGAVSVLCVDDDEDLVSLTATRLERTGEFEVATTTDPRSVIESLRGSEIDCVVSDYDMPEMDGLELLDAVRERYPDLPFILFTGQGGEGVASEAIARGVTDYLQKGAGGDRYELLANRVANAVEQYRAGRRAEALDRVRGILRDVNRTLVRADDREEIERRVCDVTAAAEPYGVVSIATPADEDGSFTVRARAGADVSSQTGSPPIPQESGPATEALETGEIVTESASEGIARLSQLGVTIEAVGAIPIVHEDREYGVLCLYATDADAFDPGERALLAEIGDDLAHAIYRAQLHERSRRYERIIRNLPVGVYRNTPLPDGTLLEVNPALVALFDAEEESDLVGRPFRDLYADPADREQFTAALRRDGVVREMELDLETLSGEQFRASVTGLMTDEGGEQYFDGVIREVSDE